MEPIPFRAVLAVEGVPTRDGRLIDPGALTWPVLPLTLYAQLEDSHGGEPPPTTIVGRIDAITRTGSDIVGDGFFTTEEGIYECAPMIADLTLRGISLDLAPKVVEFRVSQAEADEEYVEDTPKQQTPEEVANPAPEDPAVPEGVYRESVDDVVMAYVEAEIVGATICGKQAIGAAYIEIVSPDAPVAPAAGGDQVTPEPVAASTRWPEIARLTSPFALIAATPPPPPAPDNSGGAMICLKAPEMDALAVDGGLPAEELHVTLMFLGDAASIGADTLAELQSICTELTSSGEAGTGRIAGPAAFVNDPDPEDPDAASTPLVALIDSDWVTDLRAAVDDALDASGIDSPSEHGFIPHMTLSYAQAPELLDIAQADLTFASLYLVIGGEWTEYPFGAAASMTASAAGVAPERPPASWFENPRLDMATPLTVTEDGRVFGHLATWGTCHTSFSGQCVTPPRSRSGYAYFNTAEVITADAGPVAVGPITLDTTHAPMAASLRNSVRHYEDTGLAVADVTMGEDKHGIWMAGAVRPDATMGHVRKLRGARISGDWRGANGALELIGALAVNIPGFPVPRTQARVASGVVTALVAGEELSQDVDVDALIDAYSLMIEHGPDTIDQLMVAFEPAA